MLQLVASITLYYAIIKKKYRPPAYFALLSIVAYILLAFEHLSPACIIPYKNTVTRSIDIGFSFTIGRIGGEEFLIVLPDTNAADAFRKADILRKDIESLTWQNSDISVDNRSKYPFDKTHIG
ncbi:MAG: hypothetical protein JXO44_13355 [Clostridia bacterium]|nr:hypothetical protein [Clostridia bacterium]